MLKGRYPGGKLAVTILKHGAEGNLLVELRFEGLREEGKEGREGGKRREGRAERLRWGVLVGRGSGEGGREGGMVIPWQS